MRRGGAEAREAGERARKIPGDCGGATTEMGNAVCRQRGHRFQIEEQPCEVDGLHRCSVRFVWIDSFGSQDGDHVPDDETYGRVTFYTEAAGQVYIQTARLCTWGNCVREC